MFTKIHPNNSLKDYKNNKNNCDKKYHECIDNEYNKLEQLNIKDKINIENECYYLYTRCYKYLLVDNK